MRSVTKALALLTTAVVALVFSTGVASAQDELPAATDSYVGGATTVPKSVSNGAAAEPQVKGASAVNSATSPQVKGSTLAFTGGDVLALVAIGAVAIGAGAVILTTRRRNGLLG